MFDFWQHLLLKLLEAAAVSRLIIQFNALILAVKEGSPSQDELKTLSEQIVGFWEKLARRLEFENCEIEAFHLNNQLVEDRAWEMLFKWSKKPDATYQVLYDALCHRYVKNRLLASKFCCHATNSEATGTTPGF